VEGRRLSSKLTLVDLAGSERVSKTRSEGTILREAGHINRSLHVLEMVTVAISERGKDHVPYRSSKLTHVLKVLWQTDTQGREAAVHDMLACVGAKRACVGAQHDLHWPRKMRAVAARTHAGLPAWVGERGPPPRTATNGRGLHASLTLAVVPGAP
jgi:hypothetical protein